MHEANERPDRRHDHAGCVRRAVSAAEDVCTRRKVSLTPLRRRVLEIVWRGHGPIGAYEILAEIGKDREKVGPPTVYRALEFLRDTGLVHRLDALNAFVGCDHPDEGHAAQFLICSKCRRVTEIEDPALTRALRGRARSLGFRFESGAVEIKALCDDCAIAA
ncbi:MAG: transcriptional repressor [Proteobacteria bacterium]|nr:transcriptional repressor [Pseudomonadota bacterium]